MPAEATAGRRGQCAEGDGHVTTGAPEGRSHHSCCSGLGRSAGPERGRPGTRWQHAGSQPGLHAQEKGLSSRMGARGPYHLRGTGQGQLFVWRTRAGLGHCDSLGIWCRRAAGKLAAGPGDHTTGPTSTQLQVTLLRKGQRDGPQVGLLPSPPGMQAFNHPGGKKGHSTTAPPRVASQSDQRGPRWGGAEERLWLGGHGSRSLSSAQRRVVDTHTQHTLLCSLLLITVGASCN